MRQLIFSGRYSILLVRRLVTDKEIQQIIILAVWSRLHESAQ